MKEKISLSLFFTGDVSLTSWKETGNLTRELAIYKKIAPFGIKTNLVTYGNSSDYKLKEQVSPLKITSTSWFSSPKKTSRRLALRHFPTLFSSDVLKTNQIFGSDIAVLMKRLFNKPLITRCGYLHSHFVREHTSDPDIIYNAMELEREAFQSADVLVVTTSLQREYIIKQYSLNPDTVTVIPNYVDIPLFSPQPYREKKWDLVFVGRTDSQKNLINLLQSISLLQKKGNEVTLLLIGGTGKDPFLADYITKNNLPVTQISYVPNEQLPDYLNASRAFILPSLYEGHPKALLEAMSCGIPCIGTPVPGIKEEIIHEDNGYLAAGTSSDHLCSIIQDVLGDEHHSKQVGKRAREYIQTHYSLEYVSGLESQLIRKTVNSW